MDDSEEGPRVTRRRVVLGGAAVLAAALGPSPLPSQRSGSGSAARRRFEGRAVLVTGGTSGIGRAAVEAFAREGARVAFCGRREALGREVEAAVRAAGGEALYVRADVRNPADITALVDAAVRRYGRVDVAFNNAGVEGKLGPMHEVTMENWDDVTNTNLRGVWLSMRAEIRQMRRQGGGVIVNTGSVQGLASNPGFTAYTASKHGISGLTKTAALENARAGIRVNAVAPGPIDTAMTDRTLVGAPITKAQLAERVPAGRIGRPDEVARTVLWLASDDASFINGSIVTIDGGIIAQE